MTSLFHPGPVPSAAGRSLFGDAMTYLHTLVAGPLERGAAAVAGLPPVAWRFTRAVLFVLAIALSAAAGGEAAT